MTASTANDNAKKLTAVAAPEFDDDTECAEEDSAVAEVCDVVKVVAEDGDAELAELEEVELLV